MITGRVIIDGIDVKDAYGAYVVEGGYVDIPCLPSMKQPVINDWYEYDGLEADLDSPCCDVAERELLFMMKGSLAVLDSFMTMIKSDRYHTFEMVDIGLVARMRVVSVQATGIASMFFRISVSLAEDNPLNIEYIEPYPVLASTGLTIDGFDISRYGIVLNGSLDGLKPEEKLKENLLYTSAFSNGETHYGASEENVISSTYDVGDISIGCVMRTKTLQQFWLKRNALMLDLFKSGEREIAYNGITAKAYYKDCDSRLFRYYSGVWWEFVLRFGYLGK